MSTRLEMALQGRDAAAQALLGPSTRTGLDGGERMGLEDYESGLVDVLTNLRHFADRYLIDFYEQLDRSYAHYLVEKQFDWDEETS